MNGNAANKPVRVMIVDDSALMRKLLAQILARDPNIEVVDTAMDGQFALDHLRRVRPDVVLMDVDMPRLDGLAALERIVSDYSLPVVMCSARTTAGAQATIEALARGAVDFIEKPSLQQLASGAAADKITSLVRGAVGARVSAAKPEATRAPHAEKGNGAAPSKARTKSTDDSCANNGAASPIPTKYVVSGAEAVGKLAHQSPPEIVAIGTSTGGPPALERILSELPAGFPYGIVIVQHMPAGFTQMLATHLNRIAAITVREAADGDAVEPGLALVAPGGKHLRVVRSGGGYVVSLDERTPLVSGHRPSVDVLFESVAVAARNRAVGVLMTGMGSDGAEGMGKLAAAGAITISQTIDSCVCHGMPKSAIERGYARAVVPLEEIAAALISCAPAK